QYRIFMVNLFHGDLGTSIRYESPVFGLVLARLKATLFLIVYSAVLTLLVALPLGLLAALQREKLTDHAIRDPVVAGVPMPTFWVGTLLLLLLSLPGRVFPASGYGPPFREHMPPLFLPALALSLWQAGLLVRNLRSAVIDVIRLPYVDFARIRGLRE